MTTRPDGNATEDGDTGDGNDDGGGPDRTTGDGRPLDGPGPSVVGGALLAGIGTWLAWHRRSGDDGPD